MNATTLITAFAATLFAGSAVAGAASVPAANAAVTAAATNAAQASVAARNLNVPNVLVDQSASPTREQVRAEAVKSVANYRATAVAQFDWLTR